MSESGKIYAVIRSFTEADWKVFVRTKLELDEYDVQEAVINNPRDVGEQQFQMIRTWYRKVGRTATVKELEKLAKAGPVACNACDEVKAIKVVPADKKNYENSLKSSSEIYKIKKKGLALILNNSSFVNKEQRKGSEIDVKNMKELWIKMGCELYGGKAHCNKTADEMTDLLENVSRLDSYGFLVIVIMSHGGSENNENYFYGTLETKVKLKDVMDKFRNSTSIARQIPKLFILQFCRGIIADTGVVTDSANWYANFMRNLCTDIDTLTTVPKGELMCDGATSCVPTQSDLLVAFATMDGYRAFRHTEYGSWFINAITNVFMKRACTEHVADLLVMVHNHVAAKHGTYDNKTCKAMAEYRSCLRKKFFLFPGQLN